MAAVWNGLQMLIASNTGGQSYARGTELYQSTRVSTRLETKQTGAFSRAHDADPCAVDIVWTAAWVRQGEGTAVRTRSDIIQVAEISPEAQFETAKIWAARWPC